MNHPVRPLPVPEDGDHTVRVFGPVCSVGVSPAEDEPISVPEAVILTEAVDRETPTAALNVSLIVDVVRS